MNTYLRAAVLLLVLVAGAAWGQTAYPSKPIRFIVPFPPGGATDPVARMLGAELSKSLGQQIVVENRGGGGGTIGVDLGVRSAPDGYTIFLGSTGGVGINPVLMAKPPYNPVHDISAISMLALSPLLIVVPPASPIRSVQDMIAAAKARPGSIAYGTAGSGTLHHLAAEMLQQRFDFKITHVPYKGSGPAATDLLGGQLPLAFLDVSSIGTHLRSGKARALVNTGAKRSAVVPDIPSMDEVGIPDFDAVGWFMLGAPANTPAEIIALLNRETVRILATPQVRERFILSGIEAKSSTPAEAAAFIREELAKWTHVIRSAGITPG